MQTRINGPCAVKIQPTLIEQEDGSYKAFFPSVTEELVEEALKKILADQRYGLHDPNNVETWVSLLYILVIVPFKHFPFGLGTLIF